MIIPRRRKRGTVIAYFLVLVSVLTTGLLTTMALTAGGGAQVAGQTLKRDQAFYAAEAGVQRAFWLLQQNNNWRASPDVPLTGTIGSGASAATYSVTAQGGWNSPVLISATGRTGSGPTASAVTVTAACSPTVVVPAITLGKDFDNNGNLTINGDVQAKGNIRTTGRFKENGSLYAGGSITTNGSVNITGVTKPNTAGIVVPTVDINWLKSHATKVVNVPMGSKTYEVSSINVPDGGIIYFTGPILFKGNVTIIGKGITVVVDGDVSIHAAASFGSSSEPAVANIVTTGNLDVNGYLGLIGSMYVNGTITKNGGLDVTGIILGQTDLDTSGGMSITRAQPPLWDPRSSLSGVGSMVLSRVTGPIF
jgi:hypothetical protein